MNGVNITNLSVNDMIEAARKEGMSEEEITKLVEMQQGAMSLLIEQIRTKVEVEPNTNPQQQEVQMQNEVEVESKVVSEVKPNLNKATFMDAMRKAGAGSVLVGNSVVDASKVVASKAKPVAKATVGKTAVGAGKTMKVTGRAMVVAGTFIEAKGEKLEKWGTLFQGDVKLSQQEQAEVLANLEAKTAK